MKLFPIIFFVAALILPSFMLFSCGPSNHSYVGVSVHSSSAWGHHNRSHHRHHRPAGGHRRR